MSSCWKDASANEVLLHRCISHLLGYDKRLIDFVFDSERPRIRKRAGILREDSYFFSDGEQLLIRAALDFWSGGGQLALWEMLETWDGPAWARFIQAVSMFRRLELSDAGVYPAGKSVGSPTC
jgi:hypothetical protein